jgi:hypothetical protein
LINKVVFKEGKNYWRQLHQNAERKKSQNILTEKSEWTKNVMKKNRW